MKKMLLLQILTLIFCSITSIIGLAQTPYSPYADITLNVHWDSQYQNLAPTDLSQTSRQSGVKNYHLAFITDAGVCQPAWGAQAAYSTQSGWAAHMTDQLRTNGIHYIVSFGGASGNDLSAACSIDQLAAAYTQVINTYQPDGLDFDIENGSANVIKIMSALQQVQKKFPKQKISFTLPVLPSGLVYAGQEIVRQAATAGLNYTVNIMAMDYGPSFDNKLNQNYKNMGEYAVLAADNLRLFLQTIYPQKSLATLWQMIEVTPMIGVNDDNQEAFSLKDAEFLMAFAEQHHIGGLSIWSINRDFPCADKWTNITCSGDNLQAKPYEFSKRFL